MQQPPKVTIVHAFQQDRPFDQIPLETAFSGVVLCNGTPVWPEEVLASREINHIKRILTTDGLIHGGIACQTPIKQITVRAFRIVSKISIE